MKSISLRTALVAVGSALFAFGPAMADTDKPVSLIGPGFATKAYAVHVLKPGDIPSDSTDKAIAVSDYGKYRAIVFLDQFPRETATDSAIWNKDENLGKVLEYLTEGGKVFIIGSAFPRITEEGSKPRDLKVIEKATGFAFYPNYNLSNPVQPQPAGEAIFSEAKELDFVAPYTVTVDRVTTARVLAIVVDEKGKSRPFATFHPVGKGGVYWFGASPFRLAREKGGSNANLQSYAEVLRKALKE